MAEMMSGKGGVILGTVLSGVGDLWAGNEAKKFSDDEARQIRARASARRAEGGAAAADERRQARLAVSRAQAVAAAGGGSVDDPTVVNLMGDLHAEGEYRALGRIYEAETEAGGLEDIARLREKEGKAQKKAGILSAVSSALTGVETLRSKYG